MALLLLVTAVVLHGQGEKGKKSYSWQTILSFFFSMTKGREGRRRPKPHVGLAASITREKKRKKGRRGALLFFFFFWPVHY